MALQHDSKLRSRAKIANMDRYLREHGFFVLLVVGIALLAVGVAAEPLAILPGAVLTLVGGLARPIEEIVLKEGRVKWQQEVLERVSERLQRRAEDTLTTTDSVDATVIRGDMRQQPATASGNVVVTPGTARATATGHAPVVIVAPQSPDEFAETLVNRIIDSASKSTTDARDHPDADPDA